MPAYESNRAAIVRAQSGRAIALQEATDEWKTARVGNTDTSGMSAIMGDARGIDHGRISMSGLSQLSRQTHQTIENQTITSHAMHADEGTPKPYSQLYAIRMN